MSIPPPIFSYGQRTTYRDAEGVRWHWWDGEWRRVKTRAQRRAQKRLAASLARQFGPCASKESNADHG